MAQSVAQVHIHLVFSTKNHHPYLSDTVRPALHAYLATVLKNMSCHPISLGSVEDHIHVLFALSRTAALSKVVETLKTSSSKWLKRQDDRLKHFAWQAGYGAFSVCASHVQTVRTYIVRQRDHHRKESFKDEFRSLLRTNDIAYDERFVWDWMIALTGLSRSLCRFPRAMPWAKVSCPFRAMACDTIRIGDC